MTFRRQVLGLRESLGRDLALTVSGTTSVATPSTPLGPSSLQTPRMVTGRGEGVDAALVRR